ncbi:MAG: preprotein translocase subunit YajC [Tissierellia bacterium]|nr:preprotein translocase subunit YajC [Tissierellia bacterium]
MSSRDILNTSIVFLLFIAIGFIILQIVNYRAVKKQKEYFAQLHQALKPGVEVMLTDGVYGVLTLVRDDYVMLKVAKGVELKVSRYSIKEIIKE